MTFTRRHIACFLLWLIPVYGVYEISVGSVRDYKSPGFTRALLVNEVEVYIYRHTYGPARLTGSYLVDQCLANDLDICFVLAQGHLESHFATKGKGKAKNSPWNAGQERYEHPDSAVIPYVTLLKKCYLVNGRDEEDLMRHFVTPGGKRYAEGLEYEARLRYRYSRILEDTDIKELQEKLRKE